MIYEIDNRPLPINWEAGGEERILQNARNLLRLRAGEVPYARRLGLPSEIWDLPAGKLALLAEQALKETFAVEFGGLYAGGEMEMQKQGPQIKVRLEV